MSATEEAARGNPWSTLDLIDELRARAERAEQERDALFAAATEPRVQFFERPPMTTVDENGHVWRLEPVPIHGGGHWYRLVPVEDSP